MKKVITDMRTVCSVCGHKLNEEETDSKHCPSCKNHLWTMTYPFRHRLVDKETFTMDVKDLHITNEMLKRTRIELVTKDGETIETDIDTSAIVELKGEMDRRNIIEKPFNRADDCLSYEESFCEARDCGECCCREIKGE